MRDTEGQPLSPQPITPESCSVKPQSRLAWNHQGPPSCPLYDWDTLGSSGPCAVRTGPQGWNRLRYLRTLLPRWGGQGWQRTPRRWWSHRPEVLTRLGRCEGVRRFRSRAGRAFWPDGLTVPCLVSCARCLVSGARWSLMPCPVPSEALCLVPVRCPLRPCA